MENTGESLKRQGIEQIQQREWHAVAAANLYAWLLTQEAGSLLTALDMRDAVRAADNAADAPHPNCWGALVSFAAHSKWIALQGYARSRDAAARSRVVGLWMNLVGVRKTADLGVENSTSACGPAPQEGTNKTSGNKNAKKDNAK